MNTEKMEEIHVSQTLFEAVCSKKANNTKP